MSTLSVYYNFQKKRVEMRRKFDGATSKTVNYNYKYNRLLTNCDFTFVRHPITRLISGYYTIHSHLKKYLNDTILGKKDINYDMKIWDMKHYSFLHNLINHPFKVKYMK